MKSMFGGTIVAAVLFVVAAACWSEARVARSVGEAHRRLATLHYDAEDGVDEAVSVFNRLPWPGGESRDDVRRHRTTVSYWRLQYEPLEELRMATGTAAVTDPAVLFTAANAAFRNSPPAEGDRKAAVERLDSVIQQYAEVLRKDPTYADAAYNFEYVSRLRDTVAKGPTKSIAARNATAAVRPEPSSVDLPVGSTVHGRPGGPPEDVPMSDFKTLTPMRYDEREEQLEPGRGREIRRKG